MSQITITDISAINWDAVSVLFPLEDNGYIQGVIDGSQSEPIAEVYFEEDGITDGIYILPDGNVAFTIRADCTVSVTDKPPRNINKFLKELYKILEK